MMATCMSIPTEIEIKLRVDDFTELRTALVSAGATARETDRELNMFFDRPDKSLRAEGAGLRLRWIWRNAALEPLALLTWKGRAVPSVMHHRPSLDINVAPPEQMVALLEMLGFQRTLAFEKRRESWRLDTCRIELDHLPELGNFVEIEAPTEAAVLAMQQRLNLLGRPIEPQPYIAMVERHLRAHPADDNTLRFQQGR